MAGLFAGDGAVTMYPSGMGGRWYAFASGVQDNDSALGCGRSFVVDREGARGFVDIERCQLAKAGTGCRKQARRAERDVPGDGRGYGAVEVYKDIYDLLANHIVGHHHGHLPR